MRGVAVNVNYRYLDDELWYLLDNADAEALVFHSSLADRVARVIDRLPKLKLLIEVDDGDAGRVPLAHAFETVVSGHDPRERITRTEEFEAALLAGHQARIVEGIEVVNRPNETLDQTSLAHRGEGVAADRVLRMKHIEVPVPQQALQVTLEGVDARADRTEQVHGRGGRGSGMDGQQVQLAAHRSEHGLTRQRWGHHGDLVARVVQRMRQLQRVHHAAAWVHRMGQETHAQGAAGCCGRSLFKHDRLLRCDAAGSRPGRRHPTTAKSSRRGAIAPVARQ